MTPKSHYVVWMSFYVLKFQVKSNYVRKDYWQMYIPLFINNILTATSL